MTNIDVQNTAASSKIQGLGYKTSGSKTLVVSSFTFFSDETRDFSVILPPDGDEQDAASLVRLKFSGIDNTDMNNEWYTFQGILSFRCATPSYDVLVIYKRIPAGIEFTVQYFNATVASNQTVPTHTIDFRAYFYTAPWN